MYSDASHKKTSLRKQQIDGRRELERPYEECEETVDDSGYRNYEGRELDFEVELVLLKPDSTWMRMLKIRTHLWRRSKRSSNQILLIMIPIPMIARIRIAIFQQQI